MFPAQIPQPNTTELERCRESTLLDEANPPGRDERSRADKDLTYEVDDALWKEPTLRAMDYHNIEIRVRNGILDLYGHVSSQTNRHLIEEALRRVDGLAAIHDHLVADDQLLAEVAAALGSLEYASGSKFFTGVSHGIVLLSGTAGDPKARLLAEQCAASNPNVRGVINSVQVQGVISNPSDLPFAQPQIGAEFFFVDGVSGRVRQVIIDPDNRRVTDITLQSRFVDPQHDLNASRNSGSRPSERTLVIPMQAVRYLTAHSGSLNVRSSQSDQYSEFDPADFLIPQSEWKPPYPYCRADVLFRAKEVQASPQGPEQTQSPVALALAHQVLKDEMLENDSLGG